LIDAIRKTHLRERGTSLFPVTCEVDLRDWALLGSSGILTGPTTHWIDTCALADRYLANTPFQGRNFDWLGGHYVREAPEGYPQAVYEGDPRLVVDPLAAGDLESLWSVIRK